MPRTGAYIMRSGSFEATISASEGNITIGHSGSVKFIDAASGSVAELTSSTSGSTMQTEFVLGERVAEKPFWVFKPDGRMQYSKGGTTKVTEVDMNEKFLVASRSSHDSVDKFEHMEVKERAHEDKKTTIDAQENTFAKGLVVSGSNPYLSLYDTDDLTLTQINHNRYFYVSSSYAWNVGHTLNASAGAAGSHWGVQAGIGLSTPPTEFHINRDGDGWFKGDVSAGGYVSASGQLYGTKLNLTDGSYVEWNANTWLREHGDILYITGEDKIKLGGAVYTDVITFANGDATPDVSGGNVFKTLNLTATTITGLDGGTAGQIVTIIINDNNTDFTDGTNFNLFRSLDWTTAAKDDVLVMVCVDGTKWTCINRMDNS